MNIKIGSIILVIISLFVIKISFGDGALIEKVPENDTSKYYTYEKNKIIQSNK